MAAEFYCVDVDFPSIQEVNLGIILQELKRESTVKLDQRQHYEKCIAIIDSQKDLVFNNTSIKKLMDCKTQDLVKNIIGIVLKKKKVNMEFAENKQLENLSPEPYVPYKKYITAPDTLYQQNGQLFDSSRTSNQQNNRGSRGSQKLQRINNKGLGGLQNISDSFGCDNIEQVINELLLFGKKQKQKQRKLFLKKVHTLISESTSKQSKIHDEEQNVIFSDDSISVEFQKNKKNLLLKIFLCEYSIKLEEQNHDNSDEIDFAEPVILVVIEDITDQIIKKELESITQYRLKLLASISHELKTPLNASINILEGLHGQLSDDIFQSYIKPALSSNKFLFNVFNDILDYSAIEAKKFSYNNSKFNIREILNECIDIISFQASMKNLIINFTYDEHIPQYIISDPARIRQVLLNLLGNAMKFTMAGTISLSALLQPDGLIELSVQDTGIGISKENQPMIFNLCGQREFLMENSKLQLNTQGAGLGLSVSSQLVKGLSSKSEIFLESEHMKGSKFYFYVYDRPEQSPQNYIHQQSYASFQRNQTPAIENTTQNIQNNNLSYFSNINMNNYCTTVTNTIQHSELVCEIVAKRRDSCNISRFSKFDDEVIQNPNVLRIEKFKINDEIVENDVTEDDFLCQSQFQKNKQNLSNYFLHKQDDYETQYDINNITGEQNQYSENISNSNNNNNNSNKNNKINFNYSISPSDQKSGGLNGLNHLCHITVPIFLPPLPFLQSQSNSFSQKDQIIASSMDSSLTPKTIHPKLSISQLLNRESIIANKTVNLPKSIFEWQTDSIRFDDQQVSSPQRTEKSKAFTEIKASPYKMQDSKSENKSILQEIINKKTCSCCSFLCIDDNEFNLLILGRMIKKIGFYCEVASSGQAGIDLVKNKFNQNQCCKVHQMIFCDIDMPVKDGFQTSLEITGFLKSKGLSQQQLPPITTCSALNLPDFKQKCKKSGMTYFLPKPVDKQQLEELILIAFQNDN